MTDDQIDEPILAAVGTHWMKVAKAIPKAAATHGIHLPEGDAGYFIVAKRIEALVDDGRLDAQ